MRLAIITPTIGRGSLVRAIESGREQLNATDEWWIVGDGHLPEAERFVEAIGDTRLRYAEHSDTQSEYGNAQRNFAMQRSAADYFAFLDDDDIFLPGALAAIHGALGCGRPLMFRMDYRAGNCILWRERIISRGNVSASMFVVPNSPTLSQWPIGPDARYSDFQFIKSTMALWPAHSLRWCPDIICRCEQHGYGLS